MASLGPKPTLGYPGTRAVGPQQDPMQKAPHSPQSTHSPGAFPGMFAGGIKLVKNNYYGSSITSLQFKSVQCNRSYFELFDHKHTYLLQYLGHVDYL